MARILTRLWGPPLSAETAPAPPPTPSPTPTPSPSPTPPPPRTSPVPPPAASARPPSYMTPHPASSTTTPPHTSPAPPPGASPSSTPTPTPTLPPLPPPTPAPPSPAAPPRVSPAPRTSPAPAPCPPAASPSPAPTPTLPLLPSPTPAPPLPPVAPPRISRTSPAAPLGTPAASPSSASTPTPSPLPSPTPAPLVPAPLSPAPPPSSAPVLPTPPMLPPRAATGIGPLPHCPPPQLPPRPSPTLAELPRNITASALPAGTSPPPCACAAPPPQPQSIEKGASLFGLLTPVVLSTFPFIYQVHTGSIHKTTKLFGTPAMVSAFINSITWLMYGIVISKSGMSPTLLLLHALTCMSTFTYLMFVYADRKATVKGYMLGSSFILSLSVIFTVLYWDLTSSWIMTELFGCLGLGSLAYCHYIQISDILNGITERSQEIATAINLLPNCLVNLETVIITAQRHPNHGFVLVYILILLNNCSF
nr:vegetative cell wall protein gp1-like isoform X1 [Setaria viridis]XP_034602845.1 vegetative cell wall protein gp1-like isoform X1 [Setaria viridis]